MSESVNPSAADIKGKYIEIQRGRKVDPDSDDPELDNSDSGDPGDSDSGDDPLTDVEDDPASFEDDTSEPARVWTCSTWTDASTARYLSDPPLHCATAPAHLRRAFF